MPQRALKPKRRLPSAPCRFNLRRCYFGSIRLTFAAPLAYTRAVHVVVESPDFAADAKAAGLTEEEMRRIIDQLARKPDAGDVIPGTGGARKIRVAGRGKGKSGGYRVITFYTGADLPVFLLTVFGKGQKIDLTQAERNALRKELAGLADDYRKGISRHVRSR
jgi:hypothetical protein